MDGWRKEGNGTQTPTQQAAEPTTEYVLLRGAVTGPSFVAPPKSDTHTFSQVLLSAAN